VIIFASRPVVVERRLCGSACGKNIIFTVLLVCRFFVSKIEVAGFSREKQHGHKFSFAQLNVDL
jgi:hypothetical protein